ncbi:MAG: iron-sulfur cluster assembly scaffold protein [Pseudomonadota bacterium]
MENIYKKQLFEWVQAPKYYKDTLSDKTRSSEVKNPLCGDTIALGADFNGDKLVWSGEGCIICRAAAECFCEAVNSDDMKKIQELADHIIADYEEDTSLCTEFAAFQDVKTIGQRIKCVTLVAKAAKKLL